MNRGEAIFIAFDAAVFDFKVRVSLGEVTFPGLVICKIEIATGTRIDYRKFAIVVDSINIYY